MEELKQIYAGQMSTDENGRITHVLGIEVENLRVEGMLTEDFKYQLPTRTCYQHTKLDYDRWLREEGNQNGDEDSEDDQSLLDDIINGIIDFDTSEDERPEDEEDERPINEILESIEN